MNHTDRINIIIGISKRLATEEWGIIDLTLNQFGLPTVDSWGGGGDKIGYVIQMVQEANDNELEALAVHLDIILSSVSAKEIESSYWAMDTFRVFLSHISADKERTAQIQLALEHFNVSAFVAHVDIEPIKEWQTEIEIALDSCDALVALITPKFHDSNWTDQEVGIAIGRGILIVAVRLGSDPYGFIGKYQGLQGNNKSPDQIALGIVKILLNNKQTEKKMVSALVRSFEMSSGFQEAKDFMTILEEVQWLDELLVERIKMATINNRQIEHAFGLPQRVENLAKKFLDVAI